jgi:hypothetical protein
MELLVQLIPVAVGGVEMAQHLLKQMAELAAQA